MKDILVVCSSKTGNTRLLAEELYKMNEEKIDLVDIESNPDPTDYNKVIVAYWADLGMADPKMREYLPKIQGKEVGIVATSGMPPASPHGRGVLEYGIDILESQGNQIMATFGCQGKVHNIERIMSAMPEKHLAMMTDEFIDKITNNDHPNREDIKNMKNIFKKMVE